MTFRVGQRVECIQSPVSESDIPAPLVGERFTVIWSAVTLGHHVIDLLEKPYPAGNGFYRGIPAKFFRALVERKTSIEIFQHMLLPQGENADA